MEYYSGIKMNEILSFAQKWVELEEMMLSEIRHKRQIPHVLPYTKELNLKTTRIQSEWRMLISIILKG